MKTYRMIVKTETVDNAGRTISNTERVRNILDTDLDARREAARKSAPLGSIRTIRVVNES